MRIALAAPTAEDTRGIKALHNRLRIKREAEAEKAPPPADPGRRPS